MALIWRTNKPLWLTHNAVIMESGFYLLKFFIGVYKREVYVSAVVKNHRYWSSGSNGDQINTHFEKVNR